MNLEQKPAPRSEALMLPDRRCPGARFNLTPKDVTTFAPPRSIARDGPRTAQPCSIFGNGPASLFTEAVAWWCKVAKWERVRRLRYGCLIRLFRHRYGYQLPDDDAGREDLGCCCRTSRWQLPGPRRKCEPQ